MLPLFVVWIKLIEEIKWHTCTLSHHSGRQIWEVTRINHNVSSLINVTLRFLCQINNGFPLKKACTPVNWARAQQVRTEGWRRLTWQIYSKIKTRKNLFHLSTKRQAMIIREVVSHKLGCNEFLFSFSLKEVCACFSGLPLPLFTFLLSQFDSITTHKSIAGPLCSITPKWHWNTEKWWKCLL